MQAGAAGFISKTSEIEELANVVKRVMDGCVFFPNMASSLVGHNNLSLSDRDLIQKLSDRELTILKYLSLGCTNVMVPVQSQNILPHPAMIVCL